MRAWLIATLTVVASLIAVTVVLITALIAIAVVLITTLTIIVRPWLVRSLRTISVRIIAIGILLFMLPFLLGLCTGCKFAGNILPTVVMRIHRIRA